MLSTREASVPSNQEPDSAHDSICERIATILNSSSKTARVLSEINKHDVYLHQSGMAAIYRLYQVLLQWWGTQSVVFGFPYELTLKMLETYGLGCRFFAFATTSELDDLKVYLDTKK